MVPRNKRPKKSAFEITFPSPLPPPTYTSPTPPISHVYIIRAITVFSKRIRIRATGTVLFQGIRGVTIPRDTLRSKKEVKSGREKEWGFFSDQGKGEKKIVGEMKKT